MKIIKTSARKKLVFSGITTAIAISISPAAVVYNEDFESYNLSGGGNIADVRVLSGPWSNDPAATYDWRVDSGTTPSGGTGPSVDHTLGTNAGRYLYTEGSFFGGPAPTQGSTFTAVSPSIDISGYTTLNLSYWVNMNGGATGSLILDLSSDGGTSWDLAADTISGNNGDVWLNRNVDLTAYEGSSQFRMRVTHLRSPSVQWESDAAIDDFQITGVVPIPEPSSSILMALGIGMLSFRRRRK